VPFFIKPITNGVAGKIEAGFLSRSMKGHYDFLEEQLKTSGGDFLCGSDVTGADIMLSCKSTGYFGLPVLKRCQFLLKLENRDLDLLKANTRLYGLMLTAYTNVRRTSGLLRRL
jgi:glutathione S-transferase